MVKEKVLRMYDKDGFRRRAACICVRSEDETEVLLVTSSRRPELWIVPGGGVEPDEESAVTAVREVLEEAGVIGTLGRCLGTFEVCDKHSGHFTHHPPNTAISTTTTTTATTTTTTSATATSTANQSPTETAAPETERPPASHTAAADTESSPNSGYASTQNTEHKHRTEVYVMHVTEELVEWEDSRSIQRQRKWFTIEDALNQLALHKPTQRSYLQELRHSKQAAVEAREAEAEEKVVEEEAEAEDTQ